MKRFCLFVCLLLFASACSESPTGPSAVTITPTSAHIGPLGKAALGEAAPGFFYDDAQLAKARVCAKLDGDYSLWFFNAKNRENQVFLGHTQVFRIDGGTCADLTGFLDPAKMFCVQRDILKNVPQHLLDAERPTFNELRNYLVSGDAGLWAADACDPRLPPDPPQAPPLPPTLPPVVPIPPPQCIGGDTFTFPLDHRTIAQDAPWYPTELTYPFHIPKGRWAFSAKTHDNHAKRNQDGTPENKQGEEIAVFGLYPPVGQGITTPATIDVPDLDTADDTQDSPLGTFTLTEDTTVIKVIHAALAPAHGPDNSVDIVSFTYSCPAEASLTFTRR